MMYDEKNLNHLSNKKLFNKKQVLKEKNFFLVRIFLGNSFFLKLTKNVRVFINFFMC